MNVACHPSLGGYVIKKNHDDKHNVHPSGSWGLHKTKNHNNKHGTRHRGFKACNIKKNQDDESHSLSWFGR